MRNKAPTRAKILKVWHWNRGKPQRSRAFDDGGPFLVVDVGKTHSNWRPIPRTSTAATRGGLQARRDGMSPGFMVVNGNVRQVFYKVPESGHEVRVVTDDGYNIWHEDDLQRPVYKSHARAYRALASESEKELKKHIKRELNAIAKLRKLATKPFGSARRRPRRPVR